MDEMKDECERKMWRGNMKEKLIGLKGQIKTRDEGQQNGMRERSKKKKKREII